MKYTVSIWYRDNSETDFEIKTFYDLTNDPFSLGEEYYFDSLEFTPSDLHNFKQRGWSDKAISILTDTYEERRERFHRKQVVLHTVNRTLDVKNGNILVEYHVKFVN